MIDRFQSSKTRSASVFRMTYPVRLDLGGSAVSIAKAHSKDASPVRITGSLSGNSATRDSVPPIAST